MALVGGGELVVRAVRQEGVDMIFTPVGEQRAGRL